jgi:S-formylglutathione hydrolase FrmB
MRAIEIAAEPRLCERMQRFVTRSGRPGVVAGGLVLVASLSLALDEGAAHAELATGTCAEVMDPNNAPSTDPRVEHLTVAGVHVNVLVPPDYRAGLRRYPVVYLFHGAFGDEDSFTTQTDLLAFTAQLQPLLQALVVMPDGGHLPAGRDWVDGTHPQESFVIDTLLPYVDSHYRTLPGREFRAAAGFSAGGLDAMVFAARHPDRFVAAGSFSGFLDPFAPDGIAVVDQFVGLDDQLCGAVEDPNGIWGDPVAHPMGWLGHDPTDLAPSLSGISLYIASGNGVPCAGQANVDPFLELAESIADEMAQSFDKALVAAGVPHVMEIHACGVHEFANADAGLRAFWAQMFRAFGSLPRAFDYRSGDSLTAVWGWTFQADPARASEFLDLKDLSATGLSLTGSGTETVTTAPLFVPMARVIVDGAGAGLQLTYADRFGRVSFAVDLGAAHSLEQGTADEIAVENATPGYFTTRQVRFAYADSDL